MRLARINKTRDVLALVHDQLPVGIGLARAKEGSEVYASARPIPHDARATSRSFATSPIALRR